MTENDTHTIYVFDIASSGTAGFAAVCAQASRIYKDYDKDFSDNLLDASHAAWDWLEANPEHIAYKNSPDDVSGEYGNYSSDDERYWAAAELYRTTGEQRFNDAFIELANTANIDKTKLGWYDNSGFGTIAYIFNDEYSTDEATMTMLKKRVSEEGKKLSDCAASDGYWLGMNSSDYIWGSNMVIMNNAIMLITADLIDPQDSYKNVIAENFNYLLGKNATGYSYVTGFGENAYRNPHLGTAVADNIMTLFQTG